VNEVVHTHDPRAPVPNTVAVGRSGDFQQGIRIDNLIQGKRAKSRNGNMVTS
jgi:hypothetical protein